MKITLWKELGHVVQKYTIAIFLKNVLICCQTLFRILFQIWEWLITDTVIDTIENKIESLHLQEYSLKYMSFWKLVILLEAAFFDVTVSIYSTRESGKYTSIPV